MKEAKIHLAKMRTKAVAEVKQMILDGELIKEGNKYKLTEYGKEQMTKKLEAMTKKTT